MTSITLRPHTQRAPIRPEGSITQIARWWRRILTVPLLGKLVGANAIIVGVAVGIAFAVHAHESEPRLLLLLVGSLLLALVVNLLLVRIALLPLNELEATAERVWRGDFDARVPRSILADRDMARVGRTFNLLLDSLLADRARTRRLAAEVIHAGDRESARVAHELHDSTAQELAALVLHLGALARDSREPDVTARLEELKELASSATEEVRLLSHTVYPRVLDDLGLPAAIRTLAREADERAEEVAIEADIEPGMDRLPPTVSAVLYQVAREGVNNAIRHGSPRTIRIRGTADAGNARLVISDDGIGFDIAEAEQRRPGMGIFAMRERVSLIDGTVDILSEPGKGTRIVVSVPLDAAPFPT